MASMLRVIKRDQRRERFSAAKLERSIARAAQEAGMSATRRRRLARVVARSVRENLGRKTIVRSVELRRRVLGRLARQARSVATAWRRYERRR